MPTACDRHPLPMSESAIVLPQGQCSLLVLGCGLFAKVGNVLAQSLATYRCVFSDPVTTCWWVGHSRFGMGHRLVLVSHLLSKV